MAHSSARRHKYQKITSPQNLFEAIAENNYRIIRKEIRNGFNLNEQDKDGNTPLMVAILYDNETVVDMLLHMNVDLTLANKKKETALDLATKSGNNNIIAMIQAKTTPEKHRFSFLAKSAALVPVALIAGSVYVFIKYCRRSPSEHDHIV